MKALLLLPFLLFFTSQNESFKLNGKYKAVSNSYNAEFVIIFSDSVYKKVMPNGAEFNGVIRYYKNTIYLQNYRKTLKVVGQRIISVNSEELEEDNLISIEKNKKDSINFYLHFKSENSPREWLDIAQGSGKLIKIK